jgi:hypothetical protein
MKENFRITEYKTFKSQENVSMAEKIKANVKTQLTKIL